MRIAVVNYNGSLVGGAETYLQDLLPVLAERGHRIALVHELPTPERAPLYTPALLDQRLSLAELGIGQVCDSLVRWAPDVVYANFLVDTALESALLDRFPGVLYCHTYHGTCVSGTKMFSFPRGAPCDRRMSLACLALFYPRRCGGLNPMATVAGYRQQTRRHDHLRRYAAVLVASEHMARECMRHGVAAARLAVSTPIVRVAPDPVPPPPRRATGRLLYAGRLTALKGVDLLVDALPLVRERLDGPLRATIVGDGPDRIAIERAAAGSLVPVELLGHQTRAQVRTLMREADLLVVPSRWPEPFGLVGVEAAAVGLPAVGFAVGGIPEWLDAGVTGELAAADPPTAGKLANAIVAALADHSRHHRLREGAWRMARAVSGHDHVTLLETVLGRAVDRRGGRP